MLTKEIQTTEAITSTHDFGVVDNKGRTVGATVASYECDFVPVPEGQTYGNRRAPGHYFVMAVQATRAGKRFGASFNITYYATAAARDVAQAKYLKGARARAIKNWGV